MWLSISYHAQGSGCDSERNLQKETKQSPERHSKDVQLNLLRCLLGKHFYKPRHTA